MPGRVHGLRKAGATITVENGATEFMLMSIYGWKSPKQVALYTKRPVARSLRRPACVTSIWAISTASKTSTSRRSRVPRRTKPERMFPTLSVQLCPVGTIRRKS